MKCLIIASGEGTRLVSKASLKPLAFLMGMPLIARVILLARKAGLDDFCVVTGYNGKRLSDYLKSFSKKRNIKITCLHNDEWKKENGISVLRAAGTINDNFILLMSDHIFNKNIIEILKNRKIHNDEVVLAIDSNIKRNKFVDKKDATKVFVKDKKILDIGKNLKEYNAYDTGIFLCTPAIFKAIEQSSKRGDTSLSGGIKLLAKRGKVKTCDIDGNYWIDVDDAVRLKLAEDYLLNISTKKQSDGFISRYINRPISIPITKLLLRTKIQPNTITLFCFFLSIVSVLFFFHKGYINLLIGATLAQFTSILDGCDGEIARLKFLETEFGGWFDAVLDRYADAFLLFGLTYHIFQITGSLSIIFIGFLALIGSLINSYTADKYDSLMKSKVHRHFRIGRDLRIFIIFLGGVLNLPILALLAIAIIMNIENMRRVVVLARA
ncbi:Bifunctional IPC transferase and DIPP synthase [subsurface metagenome]|jgi:CDP-L-myo-inositol myo-inositolphosphotransferase